MVFFFFIGKCLSLFLSAALAWRVTQLFLDKKRSVIKQFSVRGFLDDQALAGLNRHATTESPQGLNVA